ncbi:MAG: hypothetical protein EOM23_09535 [Candidatus Moranbacteria bacterium]|nr:hypothetical protein [Candidatus Moranbacteria bacterium]
MPAEVINIVGVDALSKFIESVTTKTSRYQVIISIDDYQSRRDRDNRSYMAQLVDLDDEESISIIKTSLEVDEIE